MLNVAVIVDSTASLPEELYARYGMQMVPYYLHFADRVARDMVDIKPAEFNAYLSTLTERSQLPKTANPSSGEYLQAYQLAARHSSEIVSFHMTSQGSGAYQAALLARDMALPGLPGVRIEVVDTRNVSMCHGWIALQAARAAAAGANLDAIMAQVRAMLPATRMLQTADTLRYLYLGGRIGHAAHLVGSLLNVKPVISMEDGVIVTLGVARSRLAAYRRIASLLQKAVEAGARVRLAFTHADARDEVEVLRELVEKIVTPIETLVCDLCPALTVHSGPGTVGLCYLVENA